MISRDSDETVVSIYSALVGEMSWQQLVEDIAATTASDVATLFYHDAHRATGAITLATGIPDDAMRDYAAHFAPLNPWMKQVAATPICEGIVGERIVAANDFRRSEYYCDFLRGYGQESGVGVTVRRDDGCYFLFSLLSGDTDADRNLERASYLTAIAPHLRRVSGYYRRQANVLAEASGIATVTVNEFARVVHASERGAVALGRGEILRIDAGGMVYFTDSEANAAFRQALNMRGDGQAVRRCRTGDTEIIFARFGETHGSAIFLGGAVTIMLDERPMPTPAEASRHIALRHALTTAELRVLEGIVAGYTIAGIAARNGLSRETIRSQLKAIYAKTGTDNQAALVRLAVGFYNPEHSAP